MKESAGTLPVHNDPEIERTGVSTSKAACKFLEAWHPFLQRLRTLVGRQEGR